MRNTLKTTVLLAGFAGLLLFVGQLVGGQSGLTIAAVIAFVMVGGLYWFCDKLALRSANAHIITVPAHDGVSSSTGGESHEIVPYRRAGRANRALQDHSRRYQLIGRDKFEELLSNAVGSAPSGGFLPRSPGRSRPLEDVLAGGPDDQHERLKQMVRQPDLYDKARGLVEMTAELAQLAKIPMPQVAISVDLQPNAFATGRNPRKGVVCATVGMLATLDRYELRGVMAHEMAHIRNRDILIGSVAAAVATMITFVARMAMFAAIFSGGRDNERHPIGDLVLIFLAPIAATLIQMAIRRSREFQADRSAARMIGDGEPLARALETCNAMSMRVHSIADDNQAQMYIVNPLADRKRHFSQLFSTHPPMEERVRRLRDGSWREF